MKRFFSIVLCGVCFFAFAKKKEPPAAEPYFFEKDKSTLLQGIRKAVGPIVRNNFVIFTADASARWTGISFANEGYKNIYDFEKVVLRDEKNEIESSFLFYIYEIPERATEIEYRMIIDGLWTTDPLNKNSRYDRRQGILLSCVAVENDNFLKTEQLEDGRIRFVYRGVSDERITLAGTFNNWDPFMYILTPVSQGFQEIVIPVAKGEQRYCFFVGSKREVDKTNPNRCCLDDGKTVSVIQVK